MDLASRRYIPTLTEEGGNPVNDVRITLTMVMYAFFYSLMDDDRKGLNAFRIWRARFPKEEAAIAAVEKQIAPFKSELKTFRNRVGFHGSQSRTREQQGYDVFVNHPPDALWSGIANFKALGAALLGKEHAEETADDAQREEYRQIIDFVTHCATNGLNVEKTSGGPALTL